MINRTKSIRRRFISLCFCFILLLIGTVNADGLFPSMNQMFGTAMPSIGIALGRKAEETGENADGKYEVYNTFTYDDYTVFGAYLGSLNAVLKDTQITESAIIVTISVRDASMLFVYDWKAQTATAIYPSGTRPETEKETSKGTSSILPPVGGSMPSAQFAVGRKPNSEYSDEYGITQIWTNFTDTDYSAFSGYLAQTGATILQSQVESGVLIAEIGLNTGSFTLTYDWHTKKASVFYPIGTFPEREMCNTLKGTGSILPQMDTIGKNLPSMSQALSRVPDITERLADGSQKEIYSNFDEADYTAFSQYLQTAECTVDNYSVEDTSVMVVELSNLTGNFTFTYDSLRHIGTVIYPMGSWVEDAWAPPTVAPTPTTTITPKPTTTSTPKPTAVTTSKQEVKDSPKSGDTYSESSCWEIAEAHFKKMRWKNPSSVIINSHISLYDWKAHSYSIYIDYSAQNGYGGYNRGTMFIIVNAKTGKVTFASDIE